jgi:hypothetical protein
MLKALLLLLALGVNLTWATHTSFTDLTEAELQDMPTTTAAIALELALAHEENAEDRLRKTRELSILNTYNDRVAFDIDAPGLPLEDFEGGFAGDLVILLCSNPLDINEDGCFPSGSIESGLEVHASYEGIVVLGPLFVPTNPTTWVGSEFFDATTSLHFTNGATAAGLDLLDFFAAPAILIDIQIIGENGLIGTALATSGGFFGVIANEPIVEMILGNGANVIVLDNVAFGNPVPPGNPPPPCTGTAGCEGDPHFKTWRGQHFDFHGECDLVLLHGPAFESGLGLDVHIRTKIRRDMSYISSAALRIGSDVLEVESQGIYYLNGVVGAALPAEFSGFEFLHTQPTEKQHVFEVHLGGDESITLKTYKDFVSVLIEQGENKHFGDSAGLMGDFRMGQMIARDGETVIDDANAFGQEWQVLNTESSLFQTLRFPQHPNVCTMPTPVQADHLRRRLSESSSADEAAAEKACEHWGEGKDDCVFDVLTTGDIEMAVVGAY